MKTSVLFMLFIFLMLTPAAFADDAPIKVEEGIRCFKRGELEAAGKAFAEADVSRPDDLIIAFDRACVYATQGDNDKAIEFFQKASMSRDGKLALKAKYNLGTLSSSRAKEIFGEKPEDADEQTRQEGVELLVRAVKRYRECVDLDKNYKDARYNIELIRLWIKHMQAIWKNKDNQKAREEMDLLKFLAWIEERQTELRNQCRIIVPSADSPLRRQALTEAETEQRSIIDEIDPLKAKIEQTLTEPAGQQAPGNQPGAQGQVDQDKLEQALKVLNGWIDEAREAMTEAADLVCGLPEDAMKSQLKALDSLNRIFSALAPFPNVLEKSLGSEKIIVDETHPYVEGSFEEDEEFDSQIFDDLAWRQNRVSGWSQVLDRKAKESLKDLEKKTEAMAQGGGNQTQPGVDPEEVKKQMDVLKKALEKAIELSPKIHSLTTDAADDLAKMNPAAALPNEEEAFKLLKEIAEAMPKNDQNKQGDQNKDQQKNDQNKKEQKQKPENQEQQNKKKQQISKEEAERMLQKAREREQEHRKRMENLQRLLSKPGKVKKDW